MLFMRKMRFINPLIIMKDSFKLKNDFCVIGDKYMDDIVISKVVCDNAANGNINAILEKEFNQEPDLLNLFVAYNII